MTRSIWWGASNRQRLLDEQWWQQYGFHLERPKNKTNCGKHNLVTLPRSGQSLLLNTPFAIIWIFWHVRLLAFTFVVYFSQCLGAVNSKSWLKPAFFPLLHFFARFWSRNVLKTHLFLEPHTYQSKYTICWKPEEGIIKFQIHCKTVNLSE